MGVLGDFWGSITGKPAPVALPSPARKAELLAVQHNAAVEVIKKAHVGGGLLGSVSTTPRPFRGTAETIRSFNNSWPLKLVVRSIAERIASVRWFVVKPAPGSGRRREAEQAFLKYQIASGPDKLGKGKRAAVLDKALADGDLVQVIDHPLAKLLIKPNLKHSGYIFIKMTVEYLLLVGEWFWVANRGVSTGKIKEIELFSPEWVDEVPTDPEGFYKFTRQPGSVRVKVPAADVIHGMDPDPAFLYERGTGTGQTLGNEIDAGEAAARTTLAKLENGGLPSAVIAFEDIESPEELDRAEKKLAEKFGSPNKSGLPVVTAGKMDVETIGYSPADMELLNTSKFVRDVIVNAYGVPPASVGIVENSNRATAIVAEVTLARGVLVPILELMRAEINQKLKGRVEPDSDAFVDYESPVPDDIQAELETIALQPGAVTVNEFRKRIGLDSIEEGNVHILPLNVTGVPSESLALDRVGQVADGGERAGGIPHTKQEGGTPNQTVEAIIRRMEARTLTEPVRELWDDELKDWMTDESNALGIEPNFDILNPLAAEHINQLAVSPEHFGGIDEVSRDALRRQLAEGFEAGEGPRVIAKRVRTLFDGFSKSRSETIARTEVLRSSNFGTFQAHSASGLVFQRQWVGTGDLRVRDEHSPAISGSLHSQVVGIKEQFTITLAGSKDIGATAFHPGAFGLASQDINCRCTTIPVIDEPKSGAALTKAWKIFTKRQRDWERRARATLKLGFKAQLDEVLDALAEHFEGLGVS